MNKFASMRWRMQAERKERFLAAPKKTGHWKVAWAWSHMHAWASASISARTSFSPHTCVLTKYDVFQRQIVTRIWHYCEAQPKNTICEAQVSLWCRDEAGHWGTQECECKLQVIHWCYKENKLFCYRRVSHCLNVIYHKQCARILLRYYHRLTASSWSR